MSHRIEGSELVSKRVTKDSFRREIINAWGGCCAYCGCRPEKMTLDHVVPKVKAGTTEKKNLVPACAACNVSKNHCDVWQWYAEQPFHCATREGVIREWLESPATADGAERLLGDQK